MESTHHEAEFSSKASIDIASILAFWPLRRMRQLRQKVRESLALRALRALDVTCAEDPRR